MLIQNLATRSVEPQASKGAAILGSERCVLKSRKPELVVPAVASYNVIHENFNTDDTDG